MHIGETVLTSLRAHGAAGVLIDPERALVSSFSRRQRSSSRRDTALHNSHLSEGAFETIAKSLAEGVGVAATARIQSVNKKTVLRVLAKAGEHAEGLSRALLRDLAVAECQLDEMWSFVGKKQKNLDSIEKLKGELGDAWIWIAFDAVNKVVIASITGKRTLPHAVSLLEEVKRVTLSMPTLFSSDQLNQYPNALLRVYGEVVMPPRKPRPGRHPKPQIVPPDNLLYVQVVKEYENYRVVKVSRKIVFGDPREIDAILEASPVSHKINTSYVERNNGTIRLNDARCMRKTYRFSKRLSNHKRQLSLSLANYHLCRPHKTLSRRHGEPTTPLMAAGKTDHVWTMQELLKTRVEDVY